MVLSFFLLFKFLHFEARCRKAYEGRGIVEKFKFTDFENVNYERITGLKLMVKKY
jgi:hypothetical protein